MPTETENISGAENALFPEIFCSSIRLFLRFWDVDCDRKSYSEINEILANVVLSSFTCYTYGDKNYYLIPSYDAFSQIARIDNQIEHFGCVENRLIVKWDVSEAVRRIKIRESSFEEVAIEIIEKGIAEIEAMNNARCSSISDKELEVSSEEIDNFLSEFNRGG